MASSHTLSFRCAVLCGLLLVAVGLAGCGGKPAETPVAPAPAAAPPAPKAAEGPQDIADQGIASIKRVFARHPNMLEFRTEQQRWAVNLPGGDRFEWTTDAGLGKQDVSIVLNAKPLIAAGLNPAKLDPKIWIYVSAPRKDNEPETPDYIMNAADLSSQPSGPGVGKDDGIAAFTRLVYGKRESVTWHKAMGQFGFTLPSGDRFQWGTGQQKNEMDFMYILAADSLEAAGLNVDKLNAEDWLYLPAGSLNAINYLVKPYSL